MMVNPPLTPLVKKNRCALEGCKRKLMLTDFACRCGKVHCAEHRFSETHACSYDYKKDGKDQLLKTMAIPIVGLKVEKL